MIEARQPILAGNRKLPIRNEVEVCDSLPAIQPRINKNENLDCPFTNLLKILKS